MGTYGFISRGSGYADDKSFEPYTVLREPLPEREQRVFGREGRRVCYRAYSFKLAELTGYPKGELYILISHGGGTEILMIKSVYDAGEWKELMLEMPDPLLYRMLWALYATADAARRNATTETQNKYATAFVEGRLKKSRVKHGARKVYIEDPPPPPNKNPDIMPDGFDVSQLSRFD